jgi:hypothetical protein
MSSTSRADNAVTLRCGEQTADDPARRSRNLSSREAATGNSPDRQVGESGQDDR